MSGQKRKAEEEAVTDTRTTLNLGSKDLPQSSSHAVLCSEGISMRSICPSRPDPESSHTGEQVAAGDGPSEPKKRKVSKIRIPKRVWNASEPQATASGQPGHLEYQNEEFGKTSADLAADRKGWWDPDSLIPDAEFRVKPKGQTLDFMHSEGEETEQEVDISLLNYRERRKRLRKKREREEKALKRQEEERR